MTVRPGSQQPGRGWDEATFRARFASETRRERHPAGSPDRPEVAVYARSAEPCIVAASRRPAAVAVLGMTPELRAMALSSGSHVVTIDHSATAIELLQDWVPESLRRNERVCRADWMALGNQPECPFDAILGDGVFGNLPSVDAHRALLAALHEALAPDGVLVLRQALIPDDLDLAARDAERLVERFRRGDLDEAEFGFAMRLWGSFEQAYDPASRMLENRIVFERYDTWRDDGRLTPREDAAVRRYWFDGTTCLLPQAEWESLVTEAGFALRVHRLTGRDWYRYYPVYECRPSPRCL